MGERPWIRIEIRKERRRLMKIAALFGGVILIILFVYGVKHFVNYWQNANKALNEKENKNE